MAPRYFRGEEHRTEGHRSHWMGRLCVDFTFSLGQSNVVKAEGLETEVGGIVEDMRRERN